MNAPRPHPFVLVFGALADERFPAIRDALSDSRDLDRFLMAGPVVELLRDLRPDTGLGGAVDDFVAFAHAAYRYWADGQHTRRLDEAATRALLAVAPPASDGNRPPLTATATEYIQVAPRVVWSRLADAEIHEPLDGWFSLPGGESLRMVACLGVHPARPGLSVVTVEGPPHAVRGREDGTAPFAPQMTGGDTAGLASVATPGEMLALGWGALGKGTL